MTEILDAAHPMRMQGYRDETERGSSYTPYHLRLRAFCEGCIRYVVVKSKSNINKGWRCTDCRCTAQAATGSEMA